MIAARAVQTRSGNPDVAYIKVLSGQDPFLIPALYYKPAFYQV
ncbi:hypothetical protein CKS_1841 [Pantoea stewartii subsp. stewartii DC283]|uniref:Uncharacterized protein n=1 Tax=Pantoea stewartii subsp. stewartii DC283 TaxID=660596 RepID=H3RFK7_PANSE|nr:hypothetical protein CKS_1841 [Pantoea stewartii subsp. stewartii DC283]